MGYERAEELVNDVALASSSVELIRRIAEYICPDDDVQTECNPVVPVKVRRSQRVDATLAWSLLAGVSKLKVFRGR
jgi:hypothetical protein